MNRQITVESGREYCVLKPGDVRKLSDVLFQVVKRKQTEYNSEYKVTYSDRTELENSPDFLDSVAWKDVNQLNFRVYPEPLGKSIRLQILVGNHYGKSVTYEITGQSREWVETIRQKIENILDATPSQHFLTKHKVIFSMLTPILFVFTVIWLGAKIPVVQDFIKDNFAFTTVLISLSLLLLANIFSRALDETLPKSEITENYDPKERPALVVLSLVFVLFVLPLPFELIKLLLVKLQAPR